MCVNICYLFFLFCMFCFCEDGIDVNCISYVFVEFRELKVRRRLYWMVGDGVEWGFGRIWIVESLWIRDVLECDVIWWCFFEVY